MKICCVESEIANIAKVVGNFWNFWNILICKNLILTSHDFGYIWSFLIFHSKSVALIPDIAMCKNYSKYVLAIFGIGYIWAGIWLYMT